jgi:glycyl-tRNA synthetase
MGKKEKAAPNGQMEKFNQIVSLCKRRGFVFQSSEIYDGFTAVYDFGPYGVELANNIKKLWWKEMTQKRDDVVGLDSAIFMSPKIWEASGHVKGFSDPLTECRKCHARLRLDTLLEDAGIFADEKMSEEEINSVFDSNKEKIKCPSCGASDFTPGRKFNLLVQSNLGNFTGDWSKEPTYLRGETCQGIYVNYKNVLDSARVKIPFGIAQIGKAFRNEITARQFIFRTREFEQMEMQYFIKPGEDQDRFEEWKKIRYDFYVAKLGFNPDNLRWHEHENLVFYAKAAFDIEYNFPFGFKEMEGIHARGDYDLTQHAKFSGERLDYLDPLTNERYVPHVVETSAGVGRIFLAAMSEAYAEEGEGDNSRIVLKFPPVIAPVKVAVFPLLKNKPELVAKARELYESLKEEWKCEFDDNGNIGKRYRRQDEIGTPYCVTVDFDTLENAEVTVRDRDTMQQEKIKTENLINYLQTKLGKVS